MCAKTCQLVNLHGDAANVGKGVAGKLCKGSFQSLSINHMIALGRFSEIADKHFNY